MTVYALVCSQCGNDLGSSQADADEVLCRACTLLTEDLVQKAIEELVQWDAFKRIWGESTPRQKQYVRELLGCSFTSARRR